MSAPIGITASGLPTAPAQLSAIYWLAQSVYDLLVGNFLVCEPLAGRPNAQSFRVSVMAVLGLSGPIGDRQTAAQLDEVAVGGHPRVPLFAAYVVSDLGAQCLWGRRRNRPDPKHVIRAARH